MLLIDVDKYWIDFYNAKHHRISYYSTTWWTSLEVSKIIFQKKIKIMLHSKCFASDPNALPKIHARYMVVVCASVYKIVKWPKPNHCWQTSSACFFYQGLGIFVVRSMLSYLHVNYEVHMGRPCNISRIEWKWSENQNNKGPMHVCVMCMLHTKTKLEDNRSNVTQWKYKREKMGENYN